MKKVYFLYVDLFCRFCYDKKVLIHKGADFTKILGIDFETANAQRNSACSVGLHLKELGSNTVLFSDELLINPMCEFNYWNTRIHGLTEYDVRNAPTFPTVYARICALIDDETYIIAHNAAFDISVLAKCCETYELECPQVKFLCTMLISQALYPDIKSHKLDYLADYFCLGRFAHHDALADAIKCVELFEKMLMLSGCDTLDSFLLHSHTSPGELTENGYERCCTHICKPKKEKPSAKEKMEVSSKYISGKTFVFTGTLARFERDELPELISRGGGYYKNTVTKMTDYLVVGCYGTVTQKQKKASALIEAGICISVIDESEFYAMLAGERIPSAVT